MAKEDLYSVLGVSKTATQEQIEAAYKKLRRVNHPDMIQDPDKKKAAEAKFQKITEAYRTLSDPQQRQMYDRPGFSGGHHEGDFGGFSGFNGFNMGGFAFNMEDIFDMLRNQGQQKKHHTINISIKDAFKGAAKLLDIVEEVPCNRCSGRGCMNCRWQGRTKSEKRHEVKIPAGIRTGEAIEIDKRNLIVINIVSDNRYTVNGVNLETNMTINAEQFKAAGRILQLQDIDDNRYTHYVGTEYRVFTARVIVKGKGLWYNTSRSQRGDLLINLSLDYS